MGCRTLDAVFAVAKIDQVQIPFHNGILAVTLFKILRLEDLHDLTADRYGIVAGHILDQLLGNGRAAGVTGAKEHTGAGLHSGDPVNTLMLIESLILNGNSGVDQVTGNLLKAGPVTIA